MPSPLLVNRVIAPGSVQGLVRSGLVLDFDPTQGCYADGAVDFNAADKEYLYRASSADHNFGAGDFSISLHVNRKSAGQQVLAEKWQDANNYYRLEFDAANKLHFIAVVGGATKIDVQGTTAVSSTGVWKHVCLVVDRDSAANSKIYLDGANDTAGTPTTSADSIDNTGTFFVGKSGTDTLFLNAYLDSLGIAKQALLAADVAELYNGGAGQVSDTLSTALWTKFVAFYNCDEESGQRYDATGRGNHLTAAAVQIIAPPTYGAELLTNGGFETYTGTQDDGVKDNFAGWSNYGSDEATATCHSGTNALKVTGSDIDNDFTVPAGSTLQLSFWSRGDGTGGKVGYGIQDQNGGGGQLIPWGTSSGNTTTSWALKTVVFTVSSTCTRLRLRFDLIGGAGKAAYLDDVSVKQLTYAGVGNGGFETAGTNGGTKTNVPTVSRARSGNVATVKATAHGLSSTNVITMAGLGGTGYNLSNIVVTVVDADTFTYPCTGADELETADTGGRIATDVFANWGEGGLGSATVNAESNPPDVYAGSVACRIDIGAVATIGSVGQYVATAGRNYKAAAYLKVSDVTGAPTASIVDNNGTTEATFTPTAAYAQYAAYFTSSGTLVRFQFSAASKSLWIGSVTLESLGPMGAAGIAAGVVRDGNWAAQIASNKYFSIVANDNLPAGDVDWGFVFWVYLDALPATQANLIRKVMGAGGNEYYLDLMPTGALYSRMYHNAPGDNSFTTVPTLSLGWNLVEYWYNAAASTFNCRINRGVTTSRDLGGDPRANTSTLYLGGNSTCPSVRLDNVAVVKSPPGGIAGILDAMSLSLYNAGRGKQYAEVTSAEKTAWGMTAFYEFDDASNLGKDSHGSNHLTNNGSITRTRGVNYYATAVSRWVDVQGGYAAVQATQAKRPVWVSDRGDGRPGLCFDGTDDCLQVASIALPSYITVMCVGQFATAHSLFIEHSENAGSAEGFFLQGNNAYLWMVYRSSKEQHATQPVGWLGSSRALAEFVYDSSGGTLVKDGVPQAQTVAGTAVTNSTITEPLNICSRNQAALFSEGYLGCLLIWALPLPPTARKRSRKAVGKREGISVI